MLFVRWQSGNRIVVVATFIIALLSGCSPTQYAYFQSQRNDSQRTVSAVRDSLSSADTVYPEVVSGPTASPFSSSVDSSLVSRATVPGVNRHANPEGHQSKRIRRLFSSIPVAHVAPRMQSIDRHSRSRKTYTLALVALGIAVLSFGSVFISAGSTLMWILGITLPLTATLLGVASLATINRNPDRYRGKGWAMAAILLGTGTLGLVLIALAALSVNQSIHR